MFESAIIVFREVLEAALVIGIVLAATSGIAHRGRWIALGVAGGITGACMLAAFADSLASMADGSGRELLNAGILIVAVGMLAWHQIWMSRHGRAMGQSLHAFGQSLHRGESTLRALAVVVGSAILREGSEAVLFLFGVAASSGAGATRLWGGALLGLLGGMVCGFGLYKGLLRIPARHLFSVTGWLVTLLAAAMAAQAANLLAQAGYLPTLTNAMWDSSSLLTTDSPLGQVLHILVGYDDHPTGIQLLLYVSTLVGITVLSRRVATAGRTMAR